MKKTTLYASIKVMITCYRTSEF